MVLTNAIKVLEPGGCLGSFILLFVFPYSFLLVVSRFVLLWFSSFDASSAITTDTSRTDGTERQTIQDMDGKMPRPKIRSCSISDPFVLILREDDSLGLFIGETERGKIRRKDMSPMGDRVGRRLLFLFPYFPLPLVM